MPATRTCTNFTWATGSATASGTTNPIACASDYGREIYAQIVQAGVATGAAMFTVRLSPDGTSYYNGPTYTAPLGSGTTSIVIDVPITAVAVQLVYQAQVGGTSSALTAQLAQVTGI